MPVRQVNEAERDRIEATNYCQGVRCGIKSVQSIASMRWSECGGGLYLVYIEGMMQLNGREDKKCVMIVSYARCIRVQAGSMAGPLQQRQQQQ